MWPRSHLMSSQSSRRISADRMPANATDGDQRQDPGVGGEEHPPHFLGRENLDLGFRLLERLALLGGRLAVGVEIPLRLAKPNMVTMLRRMPFRLTGPRLRAP